MPRRIALASLALLALPRSAAAHGGGPLHPHDLWHAWSLDPAVLGALALAVLLYTRGAARLRMRAPTTPLLRPERVASYYGAVGVLAIALVTPLDPLGETLFSAHMTQHLLLLLGAAPLFALAWPLPALLWGLPRGWRRRFARGRGWRSVREAGRVLTLPVVSWIISAVGLWLWHVPALYEAALRSTAVHALEHITLLGTAALFWWVIVRPAAQGGLGRGTAVLYIFTATIQSGLLGALITFSSVAWYPTHAAAAPIWGLTPLEDQQLAGLVMWGPMGAVYALAALVAFVGWLTGVEAEARRRERAADAMAAAGN